MANKFQVKRTTVSGRTPNTTNSGNTHFIDTGELALNLTDGKMFSSNGTVYFEVGANLQNISITSNATFGSSGKIVANGSFGTSGQVLTSNGTTMYWASSSAGSGTVEYDSLVSKFNGITKDFVLRTNNVASGVYSDEQLLVTVGGSTLDNENFAKIDYLNAPIFFDEFTDGYRLDRSGLVVNVTSTSISRDDDVYQLESGRVVFTAKLVESNTTSLTLSNVRTVGSTISTETSPVVAGTIIGRKGGSAPVANLTVSFVSVINFANAPTKYNTNLKIRRISTSDTGTVSNRVFNNLTPFNPINIMLSE